MNKCVPSARSFWKSIWAESKLKTLAATRLSYPKRRWSAAARLIAEHAKTADMVITTAQVPGRRAPLLITEEAVNGMKRGSVVIDLAGATGGNCALSKADETVERDRCNDSRADKSAGDGSCTRKSTVLAQRHARFCRP